jgi:hypothetical protein
MLPLPGRRTQDQTVEVSIFVQKPAGFTPTTSGSGPIHLPDATPAISPLQHLATAAHRAGDSSRSRPPARERPPGRTRYRRPPAFSHVTGRSEAFRSGLGAIGPKTNSTRSVPTMTRTAPVAEAAGMAVVELATRSWR